MIEADYLVVGAGAMGMAFADVVLTETDATVAIVDRYGSPGGHWTRAYPYVRVRAVPVPAGAAVAVDDRHGGLGLGQQHVGKGHAHRARPDD